MKKWSVQARQINFGYFQVEAETALEAHKMIAEMIEDDFVRDHAVWEFGEIEVSNLS